ncbi:uncharacterized protein LOC123550134 [Mercenaria mercenaria]|uniref:uncharacterized protein LOC123550134 n=1 Tax=Mercenaria mercenaria TaxID=6596 RepID=UPI00234E453D|nr:uncharacterized protein LOC123550134 [Mercenaria mercenaria]
MRVVNNSVKDSPSKKAELGFEEFTKTEIASLFPATELLHKIHTDHVYTSKDYKELIDNSQELDVSSDDNSHLEDDILSLNADSIQQVFQRMINMTSLDIMTDQSKDENQDTKRDSNDEQSKTKTSIIRKVKFVDELPGPSGTSLTSTPHADNKTENRDSVKKSGRVVTRAYKKGSYTHRTAASNVFKDDKLNNESTPSPRTCLRKQANRGREKRKTKTEEATICKSVSGNEWRTANRCAEIEREMNTLIQYTAELLVRRWGEYLSMTMEQISSFEIENAKQHKMAEEVVDMLEDKGRYVWQLIEELQFF